MKQENTKMYVLVRTDLPSKSQIAVQAGHAVAEFLLDHSHIDEYWYNGILVYLQVKNEDELKWWQYKLRKNRKIMYTSWSEPDLNNEFTAVASVTDNEKFFKKLQLLEL